MTDPPTRRGLWLLVLVFGLLLAGPLWRACAILSIDRLSISHALSSHTHTRRN